jgi:putative FmdB family regulatory protein
MPTYEYRCKTCGHELEVQQSFTDEPLRECPACQGELRKVFGNIAVTFKGSGFYKTDSRSKSSSSSGSSGSSGDAKSDKSEKSEKSDTKTETKSDTKTETKSESKTDSSSGSSAAAAS